MRFSGEGSSFALGKYNEVGEKQKFFEALYSMSAQRLNQFVLICSLGWLSWLGMMLVHEAGHALAALCTGGHVERIIWHPLALSRTDVRPSPSPLIVVWGGPVFGSSAPLLAMFISSKMRWRFNYMLSFFAGFCLLAHGLYIGIGAVDPIGDAHEMLRLGTPRWVLATFGLTTIIGMWIFERVSTKLGFGLNSEAIVTRKAYGTFLAAFLLTCIGIAVGNHGY